MDSFFSLLKQKNNSPKLVHFIIPSFLIWQSQYHNFTFFFCLDTKETKNQDCILFLRGLEINKLRKIDEVIFHSDKAKNAGNAGHWRGFLTQYEWKRTSSIA